MKKFLRFSLWFAGTAVFLLATAHFTLRHLLNAPKFRAAALARLERSTGRSAALGRIDYELFPFALVVRDAALREPDGARDFASLRSFSVVVDIRKKEVSALRLDRPTLRIVQNADGSYNFSDLLAPPPAEPAAPAGAAAPPAQPRPPAQPAAPRPAIRLVQIDDAQFEFVRKTADGGEESFTVSDLDFTLRDFAPDRPLRLDGRAAFGQSSALRFELSGPAPADYADRPGAWPVDLGAQLDVGDFADVRLFLPEGTLPFRALRATLDVQGALADKLRVRLDLQTAEEATEAFPVALQLDLQGELSLPPPVAAHLFAGAELPESFRFSPPPCAPPPGTLSLLGDPNLALALQHAQAQATLSFPRIAYGQNVFERGQILAYLRDGALTVPTAKCAAYGGTLEARGNAQLLACPLAYQLERLATDKLEIGQALAANGLAEIAAVSGTLQLEARASGHAVAQPAFRSLAADAQARIDGLQTVGPGGSLMDQVWMQLDNPLLLQLAPHLKSKIEQAQQAAAATTTSRYDVATATLVLRNGIATLADARLALPGYRLDLSGAIFPFDDRLDVAARLVASPAESAQLTDGKDLSAYLPYEDGGLMIPFVVRSPLHDPEVRPDLDRLLANALAGATNSPSGSLLDELSDSDRKHVEKGLEILGTFLQP